MLVRLLLIILLSCMISCNSGKESPYFNNYLNDHADIVGRKIDLNSGLQQIYPANAETNHYKGKRIISLIGTSCISCIERIKNWTTLLEKQPFNKSITIFFIALGESNADLEYYLKTENRLNIPVFADTAGIFIAKNNLYRYSRNTFMLNDDNEVIMVGDPIDNNKILDYYINAAK